MNTDISKDVEAIGGIAIIPTILEVICKTTGMGFSAVARVTDDKWVACAVRDEISFGLVPGGELKLETTICNEIRQHHNPVVIDHVEKDDVFCSHHTPAMYGFQSYISIPIMRKDGGFFGTLCAIDPKPAKVNTPETINMFKLFAELIAFHLTACYENEAMKIKREEEQRMAESREQFIAILGHDLRNPVSAINMGAHLLQEFPMDEDMKTIATAIKNSSHRIHRLIENMLDFAHGRMGGGIKLDSNSNADIEKVLMQVINEFKVLHPGKIITTNFDIEDCFACDSNRIGQLFSNLLGNAIVHGADDTPIEIIAFTDKVQFTLCVKNYGKEIPADKIEHLFQPFYRGDDKSGKKGLGLGLYIASEIAKAHGGKLLVESTKSYTCFTLHVPLGKS